MKKITYFMMLALAAYGLQACHSGSASVSVDSTATVADTSKKAAAADSAKHDTADIKFAKTLAAGGMAEITFSKLAEEKVTTGKLKDFAAMMITDHTKAADSLKAIAAKENITLPAALDGMHQAKLDSMQKMSGDDFKKAYVDLMIADHKDAVDALTKESQNGSDPALKAFAINVLPVVQGHLGEINKIKAGMK